MPIATHPIPELTEKNKRNFWKKVDTSGGQDDCWPWMAYRLKQGYGRFKISGRKHLAHRIAWTIANGPIPNDLLCLHSCDHPFCSNPAHLWLGTNADNAADRDQKGRGVTPFPRKHPARITYSQLFARVVELERENAKLREDNAAYENRDVALSLAGM